MKAPSFQFYPRDWRADAVFTCSLAARGLWLEMMNMMHEAERYGYLAVNGRPIPDEGIARYCGCSVEQYRTLLAELDSVNVPRRTSDGILYSKRMVDDVSRRAEWRKRQKNHRVVARHADVTQMSRPSSSSSSSSSSNTKPKPKSIAQQTALGEFDVFWCAYPRKVGKPAALKAWKSNRGTSQLVMAGLEKWKLYWTDPQFIPHPATWLNQKRWEDEPPQSVGGTTNGRKSYADAAYEETKRNIAQAADRYRERMGGASRPDRKAGGDG